MKRIIFVLALSAVLIGAARSTGATRATDITLAPSKGTIVYGQSATLNGTLGNLEQVSANARIQIYRKETTHATEAQEAFTTLADDQGNFSVVVAPTIGTIYYAAYDTTDGRRLTSDPISVAVRPKLTLARYARRGSWFSFRATYKSDLRSYGRILSIQRLTNKGYWVAVKQVRLSSNLRPTAFRVLLPQHLSYVRAFVSAGHAGAGYAAGWSNTVTVRK
jgi:hypothetical protein